ncbi:MAG: phosphoglucomutase/phosphomannomutase family protein [Candidatus Acididesulfobacter guangdongensis]|uniref:Phosphoglucomutase/phosphomannomutase family protein n=1 Tax=Acididesulfobacter guangdongensis TaxID=2597225 RepID=A0A519BG54_ACIG2|nr:MAG: phosphoglucomutase/phosphomannomutase family protein [Candidatus Acididesulfobacter guangdongensis]
MMDNLKFSNISNIIKDNHIKINFGTDGFRGIIAENFDFDKISIISTALGLYLLKKNDINGTKDILSFSTDGNAPAAASVNIKNTQSIAIGYDTRFLSEEFALSCAKNLMKMGFNVLLSDSFCPSPVLSYSVKNNLCECGIMITASHNAFMYNGIKFKNNYGGSMLESDVKNIEEIANDILLNKESSLYTYFGDNIKSGELIKVDFKKKYLDHIIKIIDLGSATGSSISKAIDIVIDPMYGAGIGYISAVLKKFFIRHKTINNSVNPNFPQINPEPIELNLKKLSAAVKKAGINNKFAVGFATDGDADRVGTVDYKGNFIDSHKIFSILLNYLLEEGFKGEVVKTVSVSKTIDYLCSKYKIKLHEVPIGFKNIANLMINPENNILIGGEESGGIGIKFHIPERDGVFNSLMLLKIMLVREKNLNELLNDIYGKEYPLEYRRLDIRIDNNIKEKLIGILKNNSFNIPFKEKISVINFIDGYKFEYSDNSWLLIRPSGTEPVLRIYAESAEKKKTELLIKKAINEINKIK